MLVTEIGVNVNLKQTVGEKYLLHIHIICQCIMTQTVAKPNWICSNESWAEDNFRSGDIPQPAKCQPGLQHKKVTCLHVQQTEMGEVSITVKQLKVLKRF